MTDEGGVTAGGDAGSGAGAPRSRNPITWLLVGLVRVYQAVVSPWFAPRCRYYPSCSAYAVTALRRHGPIRGLGLACWRVLRCNPWSLGGVDHVPERQRRDGDGTEAGTGRRGRGRTLDEDMRGAR